MSFIPPFSLSLRHNYSFIFPSRTPPMLVHCKYSSFHFHFVEGNSHLVVNSSGGKQYRFRWRFHNRLQFQH